MARVYTKIDKETFLQKVKALMEWDKEDEEAYPYNLPAKIGKDLSKVEFDWENFTDFKQTVGFASYPAGYKELLPDFHIFYASASGDWEYPVAFIFYWGDNELRAYIPKEGNVYHKKEKCAYGSESEPKYDMDIYDSEFSLEKMEQDIISRIKLKIS